jgi:hypothetical protein
MKTWAKVARYHLVQPSWVIMPWAILTFGFLVCLVIFALTPAGPAGPSGRGTGALVSIFIFFFVMGTQTIGRSLPFGLSLGASRRSYYTGTALLGVAMAAVDGLGLAALQATERATDGWGVGMQFFRVAYLLDGPWYVTWLTSFVGLGLLYVYGMWFGIVFRRWNMIGTIGFIAAQVLVLLAGAVVVSLTQAWPNVGGFFTSLTAVGLTGVLAVLAVALLAGGHATIRRATV